MEWEALNSLISKERKRVVFLPELPDIRTLAREICSLSNHKGGYILLGISSKGELRGVGTSSRRRIEEAKNMIDPSPSIVVYTSRVYEKRVEFIIVPESSSAPHFMEGMALTRLRRTIRAMSSKELETAFMRKRDIDLWEIEKLGRLEELDIEKKDIKSAKALGLISDSRPTKAGILLLGKNPERRFPQANVCLLYYSDNRYKKFNKFELITGSIIKKLEILPKKVIDCFEPDLFRRFSDSLLEILREAFTNALIHRDYRTPAPVFVWLSPQEVRIWNPGELPPGLNIDDLRFLHPSIPRNPMLYRGILTLKRSITPGMGTVMMTQLARECGIEELFIRERMGGVEISLSLLRTGSEIIIIRENKLIDYLKKEGTIDRKSYEKLMNIGERTAHRDLVFFQRRGIIKKIGKGRYTKYRLKRVV